MKPNLPGRRGRHRGGEDDRLAARPGFFEVVTSISSNPRTRIDCRTGVAGAKIALPPCVAWTMQNPPSASHPVTVAPSTEHIQGVSERNVTGRPELAVATTDPVAPVNTTGAGPNAMLCAVAAAPARTTVNV